MGRRPHGPSAEAGGRLDRRHAGQPHLVHGGEREYPGVNNTFLQPFLSYTWPDTTNLGLNTESTYNWQSGQWTVPINLTAGHLFSLGGQRINFTLGGRYFPERPHDGASWGLRFVMTFLFPK